MRADQPVASGRVCRDGVDTAYELYGSSGPLLVLLPCWIIVHARQWKAQIADLSIDCRLLVIDGRGNGSSDRPAGLAAYTYLEYAADALAVIDHLAIDRCVLVGFSMGGPIAALVAQARPTLAEAMILIAPVGPSNPEALAARAEQFLAPLHHYEGWGRYNANYIRSDTPAFLRFFFKAMFPEPHSTKQLEDAFGWGSETSADVLVESRLGSLDTIVDLEAAYSSIRCPVILMHGDADVIVPLKSGQTVAALSRATMKVLLGSGHGPHLRHPAIINETIRTFLQSIKALPAPLPVIKRSRKRPRILYLSSPIGLGHARRDLAVVRELRRQLPDLSVDWLAQDPVTRMLELAGERIHPASRRLASESRHIEDEAGEHDLDVFQALRRMDEILVRNFRTFQEAVEEGNYTAVVADEGWEVDHFWHEHPELKRAPLVWMTDFVGFSTTRPNDGSEASLTADYNGEMVEHVEGHPSVRDSAIFVGNPDDVDDDPMGPDLPSRRLWTESRFNFSGYILGDDVPLPHQKAELRQELGLEFEQKLVVVTVGGSGVGSALIRKILSAMPMLRRELPGLRMLVVTGPRLSSASLPALDGVEYRSFVPDLPRLLAACDLAIVQGGLSTCMELAATGTPFIYVPLENHFEQLVHVPRRLQNYGAGRLMRFNELQPEAIADAIASELKAVRQCKTVERDGARRAANLIAEYLR